MQVEAEGFSYQTRRRIILVTINVTPASTSIYLPQLVHKFSTGFGVTFFHRCFGNSRLNPVTEAKRFERKRKRQEIRAYSVPRSSVFLFVFHLLSVIELPSSHFHASVCFVRWHRGSLIFMQRSDATAGHRSHRKMLSTVNEKR